MSRITERAKQWLANATTKEIQAFFAGGEPDVMQVLNTNDGSFQFYPAIHGVVMEDQPYSDSEKAIEKAREVRDLFAREEDLPQIDTESLGMWNLEASDISWERQLRANKIIHIATSLLPTGLENPEILLDSGIDLDMDLGAGDTFLGGEGVHSG